MSDKRVVVLGCHRSATSLVAKGLHQAGVHMGRDLLGPSRHQPEGHFENVAILRANDSALARVGKSWQEPGVVEADNGEVGHAIEQNIVEANNGLVGWKDPRTCWTWPLHEPHLGDDPILVCVFRRPNRVAESLHRRNGMPLEQGVALADLYNARIINVILGFV